MEEAVGLGSTDSFRSVFGPFSIDFARKIDQNRDPDRGPGREIGPRGSRKASRRQQVAPRGPRDAPKHAQAAPRCAQDRSKRAPDGSKVPRHGRMTAEIAPQNLENRAPGAPRTGPEEHAGCTPQIRSIFNVFPLIFHRISKPKTVEKHRQVLRISERGANGRHSQNPIKTEGF